MGVQERSLRLAAISENVRSCSKRQRLPHQRRASNPSGPQFTMEWSSSQCFTHANGTHKRCWYPLIFLYQLRSAPVHQSSVRVYTNIFRPFEADCEGEIKAWRLQSTSPHGLLSQTTISIDEKKVVSALALVQAVRLFSS